MPSKYIDITSIMQVIGCVFNTPQLLDYTDRYDITEEDFPDQFHQIAFGAIYQLHDMGAERISVSNILDYLSTRPKSEAIFTKQKGEEWLMKVSENASSASFDYYYNRLKKMTLLRAFDKYGFDVRDIYDPENILDVKKKELQEEQLDNASLEEIAEKIQRKVDAIKSQYVNGCEGETHQAGEGIIDLINDLKTNPEVGVPLYGPLINTVTKGARLKKFYLRSAPTGVGKSRAIAADACYIACNRIYDETFGWIKNGTAEPTLLISTELELTEVQTLLLAFLANVDEDHIITGKYEFDEEERVIEAGNIIANSPLYIEILPDFSLQDIEDTIKKSIRDHDVKYVFHDYIHTSLKILEEISKRSAGVKLREDSVLFMLSVRLKDLCNKYGIFILSSTQLNSDYQESTTPDQNLLRGAKAIADKIDLGMIMLGVKENDLSGLEKILASNQFAKPNLKISVYKNRRGRYKGIYLWCNSNLGTCHINPMFATTWDYELVSINDLKIITDEPGAF